MGVRGTAKLRGDGSISPPSFRPHSIVVLPECPSVVLSKSHRDVQVDSTVVVLPRVAQGKKAVGLNSLVQVGKWCCQTAVSPATARGGGAILTLGESPVVHDGVLA